MDCGGFSGTAVKNAITENAAKYSLTVISRCLPLVTAAAACPSTGISGSQQRNGEVVTLALSSLNAGIPTRHSSLLSMGTAERHVSSDI